MHTLYDSERFAVNHVLTVVAVQSASPETTGPQTELKPSVQLRHGFEIVDKRWGKEVYLDGSWADLFALRIQDWQLNIPTQDEVEDTLAGYTELSQAPLYMH